MSNFIIHKLAGADLEQLYNLKMKSNTSTTDSFTIVVTDSGLGGLSVVADLENQLRTKNRFGKINVIFFNSLADSNFGYNAMSTPEKKVEVFDSALKSMVELYNPDMILIACNTLSVVYEQTRFARESKIEVFGIIDLGVEMILEEVNKSDDTILLLGTPTTINSLSYHKKLVMNGINEESIINQPCLLLETEIQRNPESKAVEAMISQFLSEAKVKELGNSSKIAAALCCTHYGYSENIFRESMRNIFKKDYAIINPNKKMVEFAIKKLATQKNSFSDISVTIVSQVKLKTTEINCIANILRCISPISASALENYLYNDSLFNFERN